MAGSAVVKKNDNAEALIVAEAAEIEDPEVVARAIMDRILQADTPEAVLTMAGTVGARDIIGRAFELLDARFMRSTFDEGPGAYAFLEAADSKTGEALAITCGGRNVLAQVFRLKQLGALPRKVKFVEAGETARGYKPLWLNAA